MKKAVLLTMILIVLLPLIPSATAQPPDYEKVQVEAADGLMLSGLYYAPRDEALRETGAPAVLVMHHGGSQKEAWYEFMPLLVEAGYAAVTVDLRGHGETGGTLDAEHGKADVHRWLAWLRAQPGVDPDRVSIVGASTGADLGLQAMAEDEQVVTLVGMSVLLDILGMQTAPAVEAIGNRPLYLIAGQKVEDEASAARELLQVAAGDTQLRLYPSSACCTFLLMLQDDLAASIIAWLNTANSPTMRASPTETPPQERVEVVAEDGLTLIGYYTAAEGAESAPAVLLMHMLGNNRRSWHALLPDLNRAGYAVLAVDLRGHGETSGNRDWPLAERDVQTWLDWLRAQPGVDPDRVHLIGASIGANLALRGMANDARVSTAVALSAGINYGGVTTDDALAAIANRPVFLVGARRDAPSGPDTAELAKVPSGDLLVRLYEHGSHGTALFSLERDLAPLIVSWLDDHR